MSDLRYIEVIEEGAFCLVRFRGRILDFSHHAAEVLAELTRITGENSCLRLAIDLQDTAYLPSSILGVLAQLGSKGIEIHLVNANSEVESVLAVTGLDRFIQANQITHEAPKKPASTFESIPSVSLGGYFIKCHICGQESKVQDEAAFNCPSCQASRDGLPDLSKSFEHGFVECYSCNLELRIPRSSLDHVVACKHCNAQMQVRRNR
jgi:anti-anti-sigma factor